MITIVLLAAGLLSGFVSAGKHSDGKDVGTSYTYPYRSETYAYSGIVWILPTNPGLASKVINIWSEVRWGDVIMVKTKLQSEVDVRHTWSPLSLPNGVTTFERVNSEIELEPGDYATDNRIDTSQVHLAPEHLGLWQVRATSKIFKAVGGYWELIESSEDTATFAVCPDFEGYEETRAYDLPGKLDDKYGDTYEVDVTMAWASKCVKG